VVRVKRDILITGATGTVGGRLASALANVADAQVRALVRNPEAAEPLRSSGIEVIAGSFEDSSALEHATRGVEIVVLITPTHERAADYAHAVIESSRRTGVRKIVRLSAIKAAAHGPTDNTRQHARTEHEIRASGLAFVVLRPQFFMQNLLGNANALIAESKLYSAVGDGRVAMIDARDVADCLEQVVLRSGFDGQVLELTGPNALSQAEVANALAKATGRPVELVLLEPEAVAEPMRRVGASDWVIRLMIDYMRAYRDGFGDFVTDAVEMITGRAPRGIASFARDIFVPAIARIERGGHR
jgi:uncharacterized protein YbjT (DUF2867 family)